MSNLFSRLLFVVFRPSPIFLSFTIILNLIPAPISLGVAISNLSRSCSSPVAAFLIISAALNILMVVFASYLYWQFGKPFSAVRKNIQRQDELSRYFEFISLTKSFRVKIQLREPARSSAMTPWSSFSSSVKSIPIKPAPSPPLPSTPPNFHAYWHADRQMHSLP